jgi:N-glycosylase/DNA lyase
MFFTVPLTENLTVEYKAKREGKLNRDTIMDYLVKDGAIIIERPADFCAELIFGCGQCFRWDKQSDGSWLGVAAGRVLSLVEREDTLQFRCSEEDFLKIWSGYFDLDRDYAAIRSEISVDGFTALAAEYGKGIRILRQDPWEALCTFIISQCNNIKRIKGIVERLCFMFGTECEYEGKIYHLFPLV